MLFFDIRTTDAALLPRIEAAEHSYLLDPSTATEAGHPSRRNAERPSLLLQVRPRPSRGGQLQQHALDKGRLSAVPQRGLPPVAREDLRRCRAVETERGTVLFTQEPDGREACERYMQHHADCFFDPDLGLKPCACTRWRSIPTASGTR